MPQLPIIIYPDPILRKKSAEILDVKKPAIQKLIADMLETMEMNNGVGLAAPQVGRSVRLCVIGLDDKVYVLINPKITFRSKKIEEDIEGCLSFPGKFIPVRRHEKVRVKALDENGQSRNIKAKGLLARAFQHEIDHLDGIVFIEKEVKNKK
jgi:peptide deformylase